jgi:hypothetical protein
MVGFSNGSTRDLRGGVVSFDRWEHENEHQKIDAEYFKQGIENGFAEFPPSMTVDFNEDGDDVTLEFSLDALGDGDDIGPAWSFSLKDALTDFQCSREDATNLLNALQALVEHVKAEIDLIPEQGWRPRPRSSPPREPRIIGLDGNDVPKSAMRKFLDEVVVPTIAKEMHDAIRNNKPLWPQGMAAAGPLK